MTFWKMAFDMGAVTAEQLKGAVKTEDNPFGEISPEQYRDITEIEFTI